MHIAEVGLMSRPTKKAEGNSAAVVGYARVSTEEQANEGVSLSAQEAAIRAYCQMRALDLVELVVDAGVSAGKPLADRPGGARVTEHVRSGRVSGVVAYKLDRLFRDAADCLQVTKGWDIAGVSAHLIDLGGQSIDTSSATGRFFLTVMAGAAEMERNLIRERTSAAMQHMRECSQYTGGEVPYGWVIGEDGEHLVENVAEQVVIAEAVALRAAGRSLREIGSALLVRGMKSRKGGAWGATSVAVLVRARAGA